MGRLWLPPERREIIRAHRSMPLTGAGVTTWTPRSQTPPDTTNLQGHWNPWSGHWDDAGKTDASADGEAVHVWGNVADGDNDFVQGTGSKQFTLTDDGSGQGGLAYVTSDGTDDEMDSEKNESVMNTNTALSVLFGWKVTTLTNALDTPIDSAGSDPGVNDGFQVLNEHRDIVNIDECLNLSLAVTGGARQFGKAGIHTTTAVEIWAWSYAEDDEILLRNGVNQAPLTHRTGVDDTGTYQPRAGTIRIGASNHASGQHCQADYYFVLYYSEAKTAAELLTLSNWINSWMAAY